MALALVIASCDSAAYFVGRTVGGPGWHPQSAQTRPFRGLGGILAACWPALLFGPMDMNDLDFYINGEIVMLSWPKVIAGGLVIGLLAQLGDLLESALKRRQDLRTAAN